MKYASLFYARAKVNLCTDKTWRTCVYKTDGICMCVIYTVCIPCVHWGHSKIISVASEQKPGRKCHPLHSTRRLQQYEEPPHAVSLRSVHKIHMAQVNVFSDETLSSFSVSLKKNLFLCLQRDLERQIPVRLPAALVS